MKKVIFIAVLMLFAGISMSQPPAGRSGQQMSAEERQKMMEQNRIRRNDELRKALSLSKPVASKVDSVNNKYDLQIQEFLKPENRGNNDRTVMRTKMEDIEKARKTEVKSLLTEEQQAKYDKWLSEQEQQRRKERGGGPR
jgi:hypothetical protein